MPALGLGGLLACEPCRAAKPMAVAHHVDRPDAEACTLQHELEGPRSKVNEVARQIETVPGVPEPAERQAVNVRHGHDEPASWSEQAPRLPQHGQRVV